MTEQIFSEGNAELSEFMGVELEYHNNWENLMKLVERVEGIKDEFHGHFGVHIVSNGCTIQGTRLRLDPKRPHYAYFNDVTLDSKENSTWYAILCW